MSYLDALPRYVYELPCGAGHDFRSLTRSEPADEDGRHWFYCRLCKHFVGVKPAALVERLPRFDSGRVAADSQLAVRIDGAIAKDRVRRLYLAVWSDLTVRQIADALGVNRRYAEAVSLDLGVYERSSAVDCGSDF